MAKIEWKPGTLEAPLPPVMVSCGTGENANIVTVAWTGIVCSDPPVTYISLRPSRHSYGIIRETGEFVINLTSVSLARAADWCGMMTGRKVDKFAACRLTKEKASRVSAPLIGESPISLECKVREIIPLGSHDLFLADILCVDVDESLLTETGRLSIHRARLAAYAHGEYYELGRRIGKFGFSVKKKSPPVKTGVQGEKS